MIYVIQAENGMVKIGNAFNPHYRFSSLCFASPLQLRLVAILPGARKEELDLHKRFEGSRRHNEWFAPDGPVLCFLAEVWGQGLERVEDWITDFAALRRSKAEAAAAKRSVALRKIWSNPEYRAEQKAWRKRLREAAEQRAAQ